LNNIEEKDFIVFQFYSKELMLSKDDVISFLFNDNKIIDFKINNSSYKSSHPHIDKLFENKVLITESELNIFETQQFLKWKISLKKQNREIIGGEDGHKIYLSHNNLAIVIRKFTKEYRELVPKIIPNYKPLQERENVYIDNQDIKSEECYVYLMIDTLNNFHKIGISNSPEWREKTLQSEKPSIELIASKKFVSRNIASSIEKALHSTFADKRLRGEWFQLEPRDIEELKITLNT
ncbi:MAG: GIY-YIG nuclease family protein, partial [Flavobacteriales bacterium]|nr:GIY-YIG nuclease family protein [Flavobacteriales bacterium]